MALFDILRNHLLAIRNHEDMAMARSILKFPPKYINNVGRILFDNLQRGGMATFVVPGRTGWDPQAEYFKAARDAARRGLVIKRIFLVPHRHYMRENILYQHWQLDVDAGIQVDFAIIGDELKENLHYLLVPRTLDFGIWDEEVTCYIYNDEIVKQPDEWIVSKRPEDIEAARTNWVVVNRLAKLPVTPADALDEFALEEPLIQTAPLSNMLASFLCKGDHMNTNSCHWYHRIWQYLRILDLVSTPTWHSKFYLDELPILKSDNPSPARVLISGTADYSILAYVIRSNKKTQPFISVLDMCETPLHLCKWYAAQQGIEIETLAQSIFELDRVNQYNLIVTDAFLTRFNLEDRVRVLDIWHTALVPGGKVVTTVRVEKDNVNHQPVGSSTEQVDMFVRRALQLANLWHEFVQIDPNVIAEQARVYAQNMVSWSANSSEQIHKLFTHAGFRITRFDVVEVKGEMKSTTYVEIVAYK